MDFRDIFDSFFGRNRNNENIFERKSRFNNDFNDFESEINRDFEDIVQTFGQMFEVFNQISNTEIFNDINDLNRWPQLNAESKSPRDLMLKSDHQIDGQNINLDEKIGRRGLDSIIKESSESTAIRSPNETKSLTKSYFYSSFNNNGHFEEQKTTTDELGNIETLVTKRFGNKSFTQITKRNNKNEVIEEQEVIDNLDQNELNAFKQQFIRNDGSIDENPRNKMTSNDNRNDSPLLQRILNFWTKF